MRHRVLVGLASFVASISWAGCGGGGGSGPIPAGDRAAAVKENALGQVGELLKIRQQDAGKPPAKAADFAKYETVFPVGCQQVKSGDVVLLFGAPIDEGASGKVLAYEKQAPEAGGYVLMQDGKTVKKLTAEEFKAAEKAPGTAAVAKKK